MLKTILYLLILAALIGSACGGFHLWRVAQKNKKEMTQYAGTSVKLQKDLGKVLVVYYSLSGHTKDIAERIASQTKGDLFEIKTAEPIEAGAKFYWEAKQQLKNGKYPKLAGQLPDFTKYDMVFVGFPVWWYTIATPGLAFLEQADFGGLKVVPFSTQGSNPGTFFVDFVNKAKNADILQSAQFNNLSDEYSAAVDNKIADWLNNL